MNAHTIQYDLGGIGYIGMNVINVSISLKKSNSNCVHSITVQIHHWQIQKNQCTLF